MLFTGAKGCVSILNNTYICIPVRNFRLNKTFYTPIRCGVCLTTKCVGSARKIETNKQNSENLSYNRWRCANTVVVNVRCFSLIGCSGNTREGAIVCNGVLQNRAKVSGNVLFINGMNSGDLWIRKFTKNNGSTAAVTVKEMAW